MRVGVRVVVVAVPTLTSAEEFVLWVFLLDAEPHERRALETEATFQNDGQRRYDRNGRTAGGCGRLCAAGHASVHGALSVNTRQRLASASSTTSSSGQTRLHKVDSAPAMKAMAALDSVESVVPRGGRRPLFGRRLSGTTMALLRGQHFADFPLPAAESGSFSCVSAR
jgi:hypothetical protein